MQQFSVAILAPDEEQRTVLSMLVDGTTVAKVAHAFSDYPAVTSDPVSRRIQELKADVVLVDVPPQHPSAALRAIELLRAEASNAEVFATGPMLDPQIIVAVMRAGAREFLDRPPSMQALLDAFARLSSSRRKSLRSTERGKLITVVNSKGGCGATTVAVNTALALAQLAREADQAPVALVDLAVVGHAALHLSVKPKFSVQDAIQNLHRLDGSLLQGYMSEAHGIHLLAGAAPSTQPQVSPSEFTQLFDLLLTNYRHVVVDLSFRLDAVSRSVSDLSDAVLIVAQADVSSLYGAQRVRQFLHDGSANHRIQVALNRYRKIPGFNEAEVERLTGARLVSRIPNHFPLVSNSIDQGIPLATHNHNDLSRAFIGLARLLAGVEQTAARKAWGIFGI